MRRLILAVLLLAAAGSAHAVRPGEKARRDAKRFGLDRLDRGVRRAPNQKAKNEFIRFNQQHGRSWKLRFDPRTGAPAALTEGRTYPRRGRPKDVSRQFLRENGELLDLDPNSLEEERELSAEGHSHVLYKQRYRGLPVEFARVKVHMDAEGSVLGANSSYEPNLTLNTTPSVGAPAAAAAAEREAGGTAFGAAELVVLPLESTGRSHLAWKIRVRGPQASWRYYVDAHTGQTLFRYNNLKFAVCLTSGVVYGQVYDVDPSSTPGPVTRPMLNQWVYIADASTRAITTDDPTYGKGFFCGGQVGKVSMGLHGPYVNVSSFRGPSAHYDNGSGQWATVATPLSSPHPYPNSSTIISTINLTLAAPTAVKFLPVFNNFRVGLFSGGDVSDIAGGDITDDDQLTLTDANGDRIASYVGTRGGFNGTAVPGKIMRLVLKSNESNAEDGYDVTLSSYLFLSSPNTYGAPYTSSHVWVPNDTPIGMRGEINLFYHLNAMHDYMFQDVNRTSAAPVTTPLVAMAHVGPNMLNAFYNPDFDNLMFGDVNTSIPQDLFTEDATVPRHEYVHYLVEKIWSIQNFGQAGSISEGIADYFSATSLDNSAIGAYVVQGLGGSGPLRELDCQKPGQICRVLSNTSWQGEIHDDSIFLSQALWDIRRDRINALGFAAGRSCADGLAWQALFFFPESFGEFYDAMRRVDSEGRVAACGGASTVQAAINTAFASHGLILGGGDTWERNDGFETATDVSTRAAVSATIFPAGDADFWAFGAGAGLVKVTLNLPASGGYYKAYQLFLYDRSHRLVARAAPPYDGINTIDGSCEVLDCTTSQSKVELVYNNPTGGHLYLHVSGGDTLGASASGVQSATPYSLVFDYPKAGALSGTVVTATYDNDLISFSVDVTTFVSIQDWRFSSAQLRDQAFTPLSATRVNIPAQVGDFLTFVSSGSGLGRITGSARLVPGFAARYPAAGTVHLEVFGYNVYGSTMSLGLSNGINLTTDRAELTAYNNLFNPARGEKATVKYAVTSPGRVVIKLFTNTGIYVATLLDQDMPAGKGSVDWDGRNVNGSGVASGIYVVSIEAPGIRKTQKIAIVK